MPPLQTAPFDLPASATRPISVGEYHAMARAGILRPDERVELLDGHLLPMAAATPPHIVVVNRLTAFFARYLDLDRYHISTQNPLRLDDFSEPEPDVALLRTDYARAARTPEPADVLLLVEVSVTTLAFDRERKRPRYAQAAVPEVWIVAPEEGFVEVSRRPGPDGYAYTERFDADGPGPLVPSALPDLPALDVAGLFEGLVV